MSVRAAMQIRNAPAARSQVIRDEAVVRARWGIPSSGKHAWIHIQFIHIYFDLCFLLLCIAVLFLYYVGFL